MTGSRPLISLTALAVVTPALGSPPATAPATTPATHPVVIMETTMGDLYIELFPDKAPITVQNFLRYVDEGFYDGTIFHRVIPNFVIQGGGFTPDGKPKPTHEPIQNESRNGLKNLRGTLSMARTAQPHSATSQFFINCRDNPHLDYTGGRGWGYAVFGRIIEGMDVVDRMRQVTCAPSKFLRGEPSMPVEPIIIRRARRVDENKARMLIEQFEAREAERRRAEQQRAEQEAHRRRLAEARLEDLLRLDDPDAVETPSGLKYVTLVEGTGPSPSPGDRVEVHYTGWLPDGTKFDSSRDRGTPFQFVIGHGRVIPGWDEGVLSMKVGERRKLIIPPGLAYGSRGVPGVIPPDATLIFDVELLAIRTATP